MKRVIRNLATVSPSYTGQAKGSCSVYLNGTDQNVPVPITSDVSYVTWMNPADGTYETLAPQTATTFNLAESFQNLLVTSVAVTDADREIMTNNPEALINMWFTNTNPLGFSFTKADIEHYYPGTEGPAGGSTVYDLVGA